MMLGTQRDGVSERKARSNSPYLLAHCNKELENPEIHELIPFPPLLPGCACSRTLLAFALWFVVDMAV